jgi:hypothetical protein
MESKVLAHARKFISAFKEETSALLGLNRLQISGVSPR